MKRAARVLTGLLLVVWAASTLGQDGTIPAPATEAGRLDKERSAQQELTREGAISMPGVIIQGSGMLNRAMGETGSKILINSGGNVGTALSKGNATVKIIEETVKDGADGFLRQGVQTVLDQGGEKAGEAAAGFFVRKAVAAGVSSTLASGGAGIALTGGMMVGGYLRDSPGVGKAIGMTGNRTIGDSVNDAYFYIAPDSLKEWASGTPQVDINSPEFERDQLQKITARKRQAAFNQIQLDNADQQRRSMQSSPAAGPMCTIDPQTGCHPGHDETSHPGGCKCAR